MATPEPGSPSLVSLSAQQGQGPEQQKEQDEHGEIDENEPEQDQARDSTQVPQLDGVQEPGSTEPEGEQVAAPPPPPPPPPPPQTQSRLAQAVELAPTQPERVATAPPQVEESPHPEVAAQSTQDTSSASSRPEAHPNQAQEASSVNLQQHVESSQRPPVAIPPNPAQPKQRGRPAALAPKQPPKPRQQPPQTQHQTQFRYQFRHQFRIQHVEKGLRQVLPQGQPQVLPPGQQQQFVPQGQYPPPHVQQPLWYGQQPPVQAQHPPPGQQPTWVPAGRQLQGGQPTPERNEASRNQKSPAAPAEPNQNGSQPATPSSETQTFAQRENEKSCRADLYNSLSALDPYKTTPKEFIHLLVQAGMANVEISKAIHRLNNERIRNPTTWLPPMPPQVPPPQIFAPPAPPYYYPPPPWYPPGPGPNGAPPYAHQAGAPPAAAPRQQYVPPQGGHPPQGGQPPPQGGHPAQMPQQPQGQPPNGPPAQNIQHHPPVGPAGAQETMDWQHAKQAAPMAAMNPAQPPPQRYSRPNGNTGPHATPIPNAHPGPHAMPVPNVHPGFHLPPGAASNQVNGFYAAAAGPGAAAAPPLPPLPSAAPAQPGDGEPPEKKEQSCNFTWIVDRTETHLGWTGNWDKYSEIRQHSIGVGVAGKVLKLLQSMGRHMEKHQSFANRVHMLCVLREMLMAVLETESVVGTEVRANAQGYDDVYVAAAKQLTASQRRKLRHLEGGKVVDELRDLIAEAKHQGLFARLEEALEFIEKEDE